MISEHNTQLLDIMINRNSPMCALSGTTLLVLPAAMVGVAIPARALPSRLGLEVEAVLTRAAAARAMAVAFIGASAALNKMIVKLVGRLDRVTEVWMNGSCGRTRVETSRQLRPLWPSERRATSVAMRPAMAGHASVACESTREGSRAARRLPIVGCVRRACTRARSSVAAAG